MPEPIEWLTDNGKQLHRTGYPRVFARDIGLIPCTTPVSSSPQSNGMAEAFVRTLKRDYVQVNPTPDARTVIEQMPAWFAHYNHVYLHRALHYRSPRKFIAQTHEAPSDLLGGNNSVRDAATALRTPIALVSLLDENRQWLKAKVGLTPNETPLSMSFCTHAVQQSGVFEVPDVTKDQRFAKNPLVTGKPHIRFYAGVPLRTQSGARIGTICVIDNCPRTGLSIREQDCLIELAVRVMTLLEDRKSRGLPVRLE